MNSFFFEVNKKQMEQSETKRYKYINKSKGRRDTIKLYTHHYSSFSLLF